MAGVEVFTIGGGEYIVNVFNAVASWTSLGGYKSLIQVIMVLGFGMATLYLAFSANWKAWINWFLQATLIYMCLMVPRIDVHVTDRINPSLAPADIANVPLGLGLMASLTSQIGDYLTREAEVVFGLPGDLTYSSNGMVYGARLLQATQNIQINDPEFATNLDEHIRNCVFYDVFLGRKSVQTLSASSDLWAAFGPGSQSRAQKFLTRQPDGTVTSQIRTCRDAYNDMTLQWTATGGPLDEVTGPLARSLYPKLLGTVAKAKLLNDLGASYSYLTGVSVAASDLLKQNLLMNATTQAMHTMPANAGVGSIDVYAQTRAEIQTRNTYSSISQTAMKWVPLLSIVLTTMFYALFPVIFPLFLLPSTGMATAKGYLTGFFYLAAWGPLFAILHMILIFKSVGEFTASAGGVGTSLFSSAGISGVADDTALLAGYLIASVPFIAGGISKGAMAIAGSATSFLAPSQSAAEEAAREASTGNIAVGNTSLDNYTANTRTANNWSSAGGFTSGASVFNTRQSDGTMTSEYPSSTVVDAGSAISRLPVSPQLTSELQSSFTKSASDARTRSDSLSNTAASSFSSANTQASEFRNALSSGDTLEKSYGAGDQATIGAAFSTVDQAATALQNRYGFERSVAQNYADEYFHTGQISSNLGGGFRGGGGGGNAAPITVGGVPVNVGASLSGTTGKTKRTGETGSASGSDSLGQTQDFLSQFARSHNWGEQREAFNRAVHNTSNGSLASKADSISASYSSAASVSQEARKSYDEAQRFETAASLRDSNGVSVAENLSQPFVNFVLGEQRKLAATGIQPDWNPTRGQATTPNQRAEQTFYVGQFVKAEEARIREGAEPSFALTPSPAGIARPSANSQAKVQSIGEDGQAAIGRRGLPGIGDVEGTIDDTRRGIAARRQYEAERVGGYINSRATEFNRVKGTLSPQPKETLRRATKDIKIENDSIPGIISNLTKRN